jgi:GNAT superfamily N-acetyltransferase
MDVIARRATPVDAPELAAMRWQWTVERHGEPSSGRAEFLRSMTTWVVDHLSTHVPFVAEVGDRVTGMAWLALSVRVPSATLPDRRTGDLQAVYVAPEARNSGVGAVLLDAVLAEARRLRLEHVTVHSSGRAVPFYLRHGFAEARWFQRNP